MAFYQNNRKSISSFVSLCNRKAHYKKEVALIRSEMEELEEELRYKKRLIQEINTTLHTMNTQKTKIKKTKRVKLRLVQNN